MTESIPDANEADLVEQALRADNRDETDPATNDLSTGAEADAADLFEQQQSAPMPDDDYDR
jgi:hypothetical protein